MPRLPGWSGFSASSDRPYSVTSEGLECNVAPHTSIIVLRYGLVRYDAATCQISHSMPYCAVAKASALPHWPAPVSVVSRRMPPRGCSTPAGTDVFGLCEPAGLTPSYL